MWEPVPSPFTPIWVADWNTWIPAFSPDALAGMDGVSTLRVGLPGWQPWNPLPPCRHPWSPVWTPIPWQPVDPPTQSQAIYLGSGTSLVDGAGAVCTAAGVELLAATGQTGLAFRSLRPASPLSAGTRMSPRQRLAEPNRRGGVAPIRGGIHDTPVAGGSAEPPDCSFQRAVGKQLRATLAVRLYLHCRPSARRAQRAIARLSGA
jgi:hypothetical protein